MKSIKILATTLFSALLFSSSIAFADQTSNPETFTPEQTQKIEQIVHDYLVQNPQIMVQVFNALQKQQQTEMETKAMKAIQANVATIFNSQNSPVAGNLQGKVTLVEFFDYQCPHCKDMETIVGSLIKANPNLKVIYKEWPIFPNSEYISRASLASVKQGKYAAFHVALMKAPDPITKDDVMKIAAKVGLNTKQLKKDMNSQAVSSEIINNNKLSDELSLVGTPSFVIATNTNPGEKLKAFFVPGVVSQDILQKYITDATSNDGKNN